MLGSGVRLRLIVDPRFERWTPDSINYLRGGDVPALIPPGDVRPPIAVLDDVAADSGYAEPLLVDLVDIPGRGIRVLGGKFDEVLHALLTGKMVFDDLIRDMDSGGVYQGYGGVPAVSALTTSTRRAYPPLPVCEKTLLVRTCFDDDEGWHRLLERLGGIDANGWLNAEPDLDDFLYGSTRELPLTALVVDDHEFEGLQPAQVPPWSGPRGKPRSSCSPMPRPSQGPSSR